MEREDVVHPGRHAQEDLAHDGDVVQVLRVQRGLAIGTAGAANAALLAASMLANHDPDLRQALADFRARQTEQVLAQPDPRVELSGGNA